MRAAVYGLQVNNFAIVSPFPLTCEVNKNVFHNGSHYNTNFSRVSSILYYIFVMV